MLKKLLLASALLTTFAIASAQSVAPFGIIDTVMPVTCTVTLTDDMVSLGFDQTTVKAFPAVDAFNAFYNFQPTTIPITYCCNSPARVVASFIDNKADKKTAFNGEDAIRFVISDGATGPSIGVPQTYFAYIVANTVAVGTFLPATTGTNLSANLILQPYFPKVISTVQSLRSRPSAPAG